MQVLLSTVSIHPLHATLEDAVEAPSRVGVGRRDPLGPGTRPSRGWPSLDSQNRLLNDRTDQLPNKRIRRTEQTG